MALQVELKTSEKPVQQFEDYVEIVASAETNVAIESENLAKAVFDAAEQNLRKAKQHREFITARADADRKAGHFTRHPSDDPLFWILPEDQKRLFNEFIPLNPTDEEAREVMCCTITRERRWGAIPKWLLTKYGSEAWKILVHRSTALALGAQKAPAAPAGSQ